MLVSLGKNMFPKLPTGNAGDNSLLADVAQEELSLTSKTLLLDVLLALSLTSVYASFF